VLLGDIRSAFNDKGTKVRDLFGAEQVAIASAKLVEVLVGLVGRPWAEMGKARKPLTQNGLARMLKPLGIAPEKTGPKDKRVSGYTRSQFEDAFARYLPPEGGSQPDTRTPCDEIRTSEIFEPDTSAPGCPVEKCEKPNNDGPVSGCPVAEGGIGENTHIDPSHDDEEPPPLMPCAHCGRTDGTVYEMNDLSHGRAFDRASGAPTACPVVYLHEDCTQPYFARSGGQAGQSNGQGAGNSASVHLMLTQETKRRLRVCGYSDAEIATLTPQQAQEILARQGWQEWHP
jgi:hypothetical protein